SCEGVPAPHPVERKSAPVPRFLFAGASSYLVVELLDDDLVHLELAAGTAPAIEQPIYTTPMVARRDYHGPSSFSEHGNRLETPELALEVETPSLCVQVRDKLRARELTRFCPQNLQQAWKGLNFSREGTENLYGLGEQFLTPGV